MKMMDKLEKIAPPGVNIKTELRAYIWCNVFAIVYSMGFIFKYLDAYDRLYIYSGYKKMLNTAASMESFSSLIDSSFICFLIPVVAAVAYIVYHYIYYYQSSKSIYLMKRLPKRSELYKRCIVLPLMSILASAIVLLVVILIYYGIYRVFTPIECLYNDIAVSTAWRIK